MDDSGSGDPVISLCNIQVFVIDCEYIGRTETSINIDPPM